MTTTPQHLNTIFYFDDSILHMATATAERSRPADPARIASIRVGPLAGNDTESTTFQVEEWIWTRSPYFRAAFDGQFIEAASRTIELADDDPEQVALYLHWLQTKSLFTVTESGYWYSDYLSLDVRVTYLRFPVGWTLNRERDTYRVRELMTDTEFAETYTFARRMGDTEYAEAVAEDFVQAGIDEEVTWLSAAAVEEFWYHDLDYRLSGLRRALLDMCVKQYAQMLKWIDDGMLDIRINSSRRTLLSKPPNRPRVRTTDLVRRLLRYNDYSDAFCDDLESYCISHHFPGGNPVLDSDGEDDLDPDTDEQIPTHPRIEMLRNESRR